MKFRPLHDRVVVKRLEEEQKTKEHLLDKFVDTMYKGSASKLVMQLLGNKKTSDQDLQEIKEILKKLEE